MSVNTRSQKGPLAGASAIRYRRAAAWAVLIVALGVVPYALAIIILSFTTSFYNRPLDIAMYFATAAALRSHPGVNIYDPAVLVAAARQHPGCTLWPGANYPYPPLLAVLLEPLTILPYAQVAHYWLLGNIALWALDTALLVYWLRVLLAGEDTPKQTLRQRALLWLRGEPDRKSLAAVCVIAASVLAWPVLDGALMGQITLVLLAVFLFVPMLVRGDHEISAGMLLAFATMLKLLPAVLIFYYLMRGRWRVVGGAVAGLAILTGFLLVTAGPRVLLDASAILLYSGDVVHIGSNEALAQAPIWIAVALGQPVTSVTLQLGKLLVAIVALTFTGGLMVRWRALHLGGRDASGENGNVPEDLLGYGWTLCAMVLLSPLVWPHYNAWLLLPFVLCLGHDLHGRHISVKRLALYAVLYAVLFLPWSLGLDADNFAAGAIVFGVGTRALLLLLHPAGVVGLWVLAGWRYLSPWLRSRSGGSRARLAPVAAGTH